LGQTIDRSKYDASRGRIGFNAFLERLDRVYYGNLIGNGIQLYEEVRCGLAHEYLIETSGKKSKDMAVTYEFKNLEIDMPRASGPGWKRDRKCEVEN
jgi:hypothetical protein